MFGVLPFKSTTRAIEVDIEFLLATYEDAEALASLRVEAMRPSLEAIGRFNPEVARTRFLDKFDPASTRKILKSGVFVGFYVLLDKGSHAYLDHLYIKPEFQGCGYGGFVMDGIKNYSVKSGLPIQLGALRNSKSNEFYKSHGFIKTHEEEWDIYYQWQSGQ